MWFLVLTLGVQLAAFFSKSEPPMISPDGVICYRVPINESVVGAHVLAASASSASSPISGVDYSIFPHKEK